MSIKQREIYTSRYYRHGNSYAIVVPPDLREAMKLVPGDVLAMNVEHGLLWAVKLTPSMVATRAQVAKIFDSLFPDKADADASE